MKTTTRFVLLTLGPARLLTRAQLPFGQLECLDPTDRWGV